MFKKKNRGKTKEQLVMERKQMETAQRQRQLARDILFPILEKNSESIQHAQRSCEVMKVVVTSAMQKPFKDKTVGDLGLEKELAEEKDVKDRAMFEEMISGFKDVPIAEALKLFEGMGGAIDGYIRAESAKKPFSDIKVDDLIAA